MASWWAGLCGVVPAAAALLARFVEEDGLHGDAGVVLAGLLNKSDPVVQQRFVDCCQ